MAIPQLTVPGRRQSPWGSLDAPRNPAIGAAGAAAGGILGMPWSVVVPILLSVFGGLFEKEEDPLDEAMRMQQQMKTLGMKPPYQSPYLPQMNEAAMRAVLSQLGRTTNWGWPAGQQLDTSWIENMLANLPTGTGGTRRRIRV